MCAFDLFLKNGLPNCALLLSSAVYLSLFLFEGVCWLQSYLPL